MRGRNAPFSKWSARRAARLLKCFLLVSLTLSSILAGLPWQKGNGSSIPKIPEDRSFSQPPQTVGADPAPDFRLPQPKLSTVDDAIGAGGVLQTSADNLTLYNSAIMMRLMSGPKPYDELISKSGSVLSPFMYWTVESYRNNQSIPLESGPSSLSVLGTNRSGTFVVRTSQVGHGSVGGVLRVTYKATALGTLKWDLEFTPNQSGNYGLVFSWENATANAGTRTNARKSFEADYKRSNYNFTWDDIPAGYNASQTVTKNSFSLKIDLGYLPAGIAVRLDPQVTGYSTSSLATAYTFQRRVFTMQRPAITGYSITMGVSSATNIRLMVNHGILIPPSNGAPKSPVLRHRYQLFSLMDRVSLLCRDLITRRQASLHKTNCIWVSIGRKELFQVNRLIGSTTVGLALVHLPANKPRAV